MKGCIARVRSHFLLLGVLLAAGSAISGCSPVTGRKIEDTAPGTAPQRIETDQAERVDTSWDLVSLGDSTPAGAGVGSNQSFVYIYAGYIEEDLGVPVTVHNYATGGLRTVADWVEVVRSNKELREDLRNAEVITIWLGSHDLLRAAGIGRGGPCYPRAGEIDLDCLQAMTDRMRKGFDSLFAEITALANPDETLILAAELGIPPPMFRAWIEDGTLDQLKGPAYEVWRDHLIQAAGRHGVRVVATYEVLNGPNGDQETPPEYLQPDRTHFNEQGHKLVADLFRGAGYETSGPEGEAVSRKVLAASEVASLGKAFEELATRQIDAWNRHDIDGILQVYTEDILLHDGYPLAENSTKLRTEVSRFLTMNPKFESRLGGIFINGRNGILIWEIWNAFRATEADPVREFDLLEARDGRISSWTIFYDHNSLRSIGYASSIDEEILADYVAAWSSGDPGRVASIYAQNAVREDHLYGERQQGRQSIEDYARNFFSWYPDIRLEPVLLFSERNPGTIEGGILKFPVLDQDGQPCAVSVAVLLEPLEEKIQTERIYYDPESLVACGWAR